jgi:hypothetical protein
MMYITSLISVCMLICVAGVFLEDDLDDNWQWVRFGDKQENEDEDSEYDDDDLLWLQETVW